MGYTVVDNATTMATHLSEIVRRHAEELIGLEELGKLLDRVKETNPKIIEELIPDMLSTGQVLRVMKNLLKEGIPIRDLSTILEALAENATKVKDSYLLTECVRESLAATITNSHSQDGKLKVLVLDPDLDEALARSLVKTEDGVQITMDPRRALGMINSLQQECDRLMNLGVQPVVLTSPSIRMYFKKLIDRQVKNCAVISHSEVSSLSELESVGVIKVNE